MARKGTSTIQRRHSGRGKIGRGECRRSARGTTGTRTGTGPVRLPNGRFASRRPAPSEPPEDPPSRPWDWAAISLNWNRQLEVIESPFDFTSEYLFMPRARPAPSAPPVLPEHPEPSAPPALYADPLFVAWNGIAHSLGDIVRSPESKFPIHATMRFTQLCGSLPSLPPVSYSAPSFPSGHTPLSRSMAEDAVIYKNTLERNAIYNQL